MYDTIARCLDFGCLGSAPWATFPVVKFLCPAPGYDRHFAILEQFGIDMITIDMTQDGPDMDTIEELVAADASIKGIWCVPKYSNPGGVTYSDETVRRLAAMQTAAPDFRIFWDNAYCVHHLYADQAHQDKLLDIAIACEQAGNQNRYFKFASTSKITFAGAGVCGFASSEANIAEAKQKLNAQLIGHDKLNQLRHARFLPTQEALDTHMAALADVIRPKFELVEQKLTQGLSAEGIATWSKPNGGYFVSFNGLDGTAKRTVELAATAGVKLTKAGATYPYGCDPHDANIRIAPTMPTLDNLSVALDVFVCCAKLAAIEALQN
jgi:DNA-binding transcriptional MocR family regulator